MKKILFILTLAVTLPKVVTAQEMYAVVSNDKLTMTFYYDNAKSYRSGTIYYSQKEWGAAGKTVTQIYFDGSFSLYYPKTTANWFYDFKKVISINHLEYLNTSECFNMSCMFYNCNSLTKLDVSQFDTRNVVDMHFMFSGCYALNKLDVRNFEMGKVEDIHGMFYDCTSLTTLDLTDWDLGKVTEMSYMFRNCAKLTTIYTECDANWSQLPNTESTRDLFMECVSLVGGNGTAYSSDHKGIQYAVVDTPEHNGYFTARQQLTIGNERVKNGNVNLSCIKSGWVTYNETDGLVLNSAKIETDGDGIFAPDGVYITVFGDCSIKSKGNGITTLDDTFITDYGTLTIESSEGYGISFDEMLEVSCEKLNVKGKLGALDGRKRWNTRRNKDVMGYLTPYQTTITLESDGTRPVVNNLGSIEGIDAECFYSYLDYRLDPEQHTIVDTYYDIPVQNAFKIVPEEPEGYDIYLGGHLMNTANYDDFRPQSLSSGHVHYDPVTQILYMDNAHFDRKYYPIDDATALSVEALQMAIELTGENTLVGQNDDGYDYLIYFGDWRHSSDKNTIRYYSIRSSDPDKPASLHFSHNFMVETYYSNTYLNIQNVDLYNDGYYADFWGSSYYGKTYLTLNNCSIDLGERSIGDDFYAYDDVTLKECHFANGFYYDANEHVVKDSQGNKKTGPVRIVRDHAGTTGINNNQYPINNNQYPINNNQYSINNNQYPINNNQYPMNHRQGVYDLQGRKVDNGYWLLDNGYCSKGVYVRNGRKFVIK